MVEGMLQREAVTRPKPQQRITFRAEEARKRLQTVQPGWIRDDAPALGRDPLVGPRFHRRNDLRQRWPLPPRTPFAGILDDVRRPPGRPRLVPLPFLQPRPH